MASFLRDISTDQTTDVSLKKKKPQDIFCATEDSSNLELCQMSGSHFGKHFKRVEILCPLVLFKGET